MSVALLSYARLPSESVERDAVRWTSDDAFSGLAYLRRIAAIVAERQPDWIIGVSDTYFGILAARYSARCGARCAIDAYDNVESYMPWAFPLHALWRRALRRADLVTAAGPQLAEHLATTGRRTLVHVLPMAADPPFRPLDRLASRARLGLEHDASYVGVGGALDQRGSAPVLLNALARLRAAGRDARLLLTGRRAERFRDHPGITPLGFLADDDMPAFVNSLDVACVLNVEDAFGRYSYPAKLYEAMACDVPVVASATAPVRWILNDRADFLVPVADAAALAERIGANLERGRARYPAQGGWEERAAQLDGLLRQADRAGGAGAAKLS